MHNQIAIFAREVCNAVLPLWCNYFLLPDNTSYTGNALFHGKWIRFYNDLLKQVNIDNLMSYMIPFHICTAPSRKTALYKPSNYYYILRDLMQPIATMALMGQFHVWVCHVIWLHFHIISCNTTKPNPSESQIHKYRVICGQITPIFLYFELFVFEVKLRVFFICNVVLNYKKNNTGMNLYD